jgi:hypothetical protein
LHKYLYTHANPINGFDPTGESFASMACAIGIGATIGATVAGGTAWLLGYSTKVVVGVAIAGAVIGATGGAYFLAPLLPATWAGWVPVFAHIVRGIDPFVLGNAKSNLFGIGLLIAIFGYILPTIEEQGSVEPNNDQKEAINRAIKLIEETPSHSYLAEGIKKRKFYVYPDTGTTMGYQPQSTTNIHLNESLLDFDDIFVASTIIHEYVHSYSGFILKGTSRGEVWAYDMQSQFLKSRGIIGTAQEIFNNSSFVTIGYLEDLAKSQQRFLSPEDRSILS